MKKLYFILMILAAIFLTACEFRLWPEKEEPEYSYEDTSYDLDDEYNEYTYDDTNSSYYEEFDPFVSLEGRFSINFPGEPTYSVSSVDTDYGTIDMHFFMYDESMYKAYMVAYADYPPQVVIDKGVELVLEDAANGMTSGMEVYYFEKTEQNGYPGLAVSASDDVDFMDVDIYLAGDRLYQVAVVESYEYPLDGLDFLATFDIL